MWRRGVEVGDSRTRSPRGDAMFQTRIDDGGRRGGLTRIEVAVLLVVVLDPFAVDLDVEGIEVGLG